MLERARALTRLAALSWLLLVVAGAQAAGQEWTPFVARGIAVDVTAENAAAAREQALAEARAHAFRQMLQSITASEDHGRLPDPGAEAIANMVVGFEVDDEKASAVRYIATLSYRFDPASVRALLQSAGVPFAESRSRPVVVVPVYRDGTTVLWEEANPWRDAWTALAVNSGLVPFVVPVGDLTDISKLSVEQARAGDEDALAALAQRYGTDLGVVATAESGGDGIAVSARRFGAGDGSTVLNAEFSGDGALASAAEAIARRMEEDWKRRNLVRTDLEGRLEAVVPVQTLAEWVMISERLAAAGAVRATRVLRLQRGQAQIALEYFGTSDQLQVVLAQQGLDLRPGVDAWVLALRGAAPVIADPTAPGAEPVNAPAQPGSGNDSPPQ